MIEVQSPTYSISSNTDLTYAIFCRLTGKGEVCAGCIFDELFVTQLSQYARNARILCAFLFNDLIIFTLKNGFLPETSQESLPIKRKGCFLLTI